ncbi:M15 family metallopeptidase [Rathayibacter sp. VKM Ac-2927]|uniref:M15 family metallopeptidase n=1 Tax=Rathayibacter sp. VKM Ac-2927 TaxID=2929478 RepID=UPI001FB2DD38|nr:M15 family metallopeptidase [Rathayibacter sp. VKM Ac-2927]MCJ1687556.1 M15 family metallopeptidase [Rathayibacter sp. VKM Ac-2927]
MRQHHQRTRARAGVLLLVAALGLTGCTAADQVSGGLAGLTTVSSDTGRSVEDGYLGVGDSVSIHDDHLPVIANLDPALRAAVEAAVDAMAADGVETVVTSGWRSAAYQQALLDDAVQEYGSLEEARKWVSTPELSAHVTGDAIDIGYTDADSWLSQHGADYGLCQTYGNEMWHFELATEPGGECPPQKENASE